MSHCEWAGSQDSGQSGGVRTSVDRAPTTRRR